MQSRKDSSRTRRMDRTEWLTRMESEATYRIHQGWVDPRMETATRVPFRVYSPRYYPYLFRQPPQSFTGKRKDLEGDCGKIRK